jgi:hypothetical protein
MIQAGERLNLVIAAISSYTFVEFVKRKEVHNLGKNGSPNVHFLLPSYLERNGSGKIPEAISNRKTF